MDLVRAAALGGFLDVTQELGIDPLALMRQVGLSRTMLADPEAMLPAISVVDMLELAARQSGCSSFGLRMAERRSLSDLGRVSLLIAHQETLRDGLNVLSKYRNRVNSTLILSIEEAGDIAILREEFALSTPRPARQATDLALGVIAGFCRGLSPAGWRPEQVCFGYDAPPQSEIAIYQRLFGCSVAFGSELNGLVIKRTDLDGRNPRSDPALAIHAQRLIENAMNTGEKSLIEEVEEAVALLLPAGRASITACADALGLHPRTLQRHLDAAGSSFSAILAHAKARQAERHLANRKLRLTDVAELLGYASPGSFTRWYIQTFAETPSAARRRATRTAQASE